MPTLVLDGGLGTELEARGVDLTGAGAGAGSALWSARLLHDAPATLGAAHASFALAGADVVTTASYQFSFAAYEAAFAGTSRAQAAQALRSSVAIAREATMAAIKGVAKARGPGPGAGGKGEAGSCREVLVAASLGSYGAVLANGSEFTGDFDLDEAGLRAFHAERLAALLPVADEAGAGSAPQGPPDFVAFETIPSLSEVRAICAAVRECAGLRRDCDCDPDGADARGRRPRVWVSVTLKSGDALGSGEPLAAAAALLQQEGGIDMVGLNCSAPAHVGAALETLSALTSKPLVAYPNRGERFEDRAWVEKSGSSDEELAGLAAQWARQHGARLALVGGCCRVGCDAVRAVAAAVHATGAQSQQSQSPKSQTALPAVPPQEEEL